MSKSYQLEGRPENKEIRLVPPFYYGNGEYGATFTLYVDGNCVHHFSYGDWLLIDGYKLMVRDSYKSTNIFLEVLPIKVVILTDNMSEVFQLSSTSKRIVSKVPIQRM